MVQGFNHNIIYKGEVFHVQTEDSGIDNPHIITLLYRGGVIISSKKTSYSDILKMDNLEDVVEELMKEQHKDMMRHLKAGHFDEKAFSVKAQLIENYEIPTLERETDSIADIFSVSSTSRGTAESGLSMLFELPQQSAKAGTNQVGKITTGDGSKKAVNLDEAILSIFGSRHK